MMQVEAVIGSLSSTMRKTGLMSPFSSSTGSSGNHGSSSKKHQRHSAAAIPTNGISGSDGSDGLSSSNIQKGNINIENISSLDTLKRLPEHVLTFIESNGVYSLF